MSDLMLTHFVPRRQTVGRMPLSRPIEALRAVWRTYRTRQALLTLTATELADIGATRMTALQEVARLPWDVAPPHRRRLPSGVFGPIQRAFERARSRRLLGRMQARDFSDLGIGPSDAEREASKPFWRG